MNCKMNMKTALVAASAVCSVTLLGIVAALVCNNKKLKALRAMNRTTRMMYRVGTAMRDLSGEGECN